MSKSTNRSYRLIEPPDDMDYFCKRINRDLYWPVLASLVVSLIVLVLTHA